MRRALGSSVLALALVVSACSSNGGDSSTLLPAGDATVSAAPTLSTPSTGPFAPTASPLEATRRPPNGLVSIDAFDRSSQGSLQDGDMTWAVISGTWNAVGGAAQVTARPEDSLPAIVITEMSGADGLLQVTMPRVANQAGLLFRLKSAGDYWAILAAPPFATWNVVKVVNGEAETVANVGLAPVAPGTTVGVLLDGDDMWILIDGRIRLTVTDRTHNEATWAGLIASGPAMTEARWDQMITVGAGQPDSPDEDGG